MLMQAAARVGTAEGRDALKALKEQIEQLIAFSPMSPMAR
jgi:hypothetical protein